ncbi:MAG: hypothetical protein HQK51_05985 [Oligoflexia bacterium]|nr:hypothetical protein [Oligoflexia bacterium]
MKFLSYDMKELPNAIVEKVKKIDPSYKMIGLKYNAGNLYVRKDINPVTQKHIYRLIAISRITPSFNFLPRIAAPFIEKNFVSVLKRLYDLQ